MSTASLPFLSAFFVLAVILSVLRGRRWRQLVFMAGNLAFLASFRPNRPTIVGLIAFILGTWAILLLARRRPSGGIIAAGAVLSVGFLLVAKKYFWLDLFLSRSNVLQIVNVVGLSYMVFKFIHVLVDQVQGQLARLTFLSYVNYQLAFFTLSAGPINRYNDFQSGWDADEPFECPLAESFQLWSRLFKGVLKLAIVAPALGWAIANAQDWIEPGWVAPAYLKLATNFYLYPLELYFNFAGYTDVAIASAQLLGFRLPENFNRPFVARNLIEFWDRWHISLTHWLRDYVFMTTYKQVVGTFRSYAKPLGYLLLGLTLFIAGVWHGPEWKYAQYGMIHGVGIAVARAWGDLITARAGRKGYQRYMQHPGIRAVSTILTFHYACFAALLFELGDRGTKPLLQAFAVQFRRSMATIGTGHLAVPTGYSACIPIVVSLVLLVYARWRPKTTILSVRGAYLWMALGASAVSLFFLGRTVYDTPDPVVIYQRF